MSCCCSILDECKNGITTSRKKVVRPAFTSIILPFRLFIYDTGFIFIQHFFLPVLRLCWWNTVQLTVGASESSQLLSLFVFIFNFIYMYINFFNSFFESVNRKTALLSRWNLKPGNIYIALIFCQDAVFNSRLISLTFWSYFRDLFFISFHDSMYILSLHP